ncbi:MAG: tyrosine--tRNA ligase [Actinomycetota bacterium]|nr:tyrosine--tRNA ligase [Actinomycetota bacterium]
MREDAGVATDILEELTWRGLVQQSTDLGALANHLREQPRTLYCGFDPTAPSLHIGHLLQTLTLRRFQLAGHRPLALVGGATGLIGDPKLTGERQLNDADVVAQWSERIRSQLERFLDFDDATTGAVMVNNYDWTAAMSTLDFLRDVGKHFPVNRMLDREAVAARLAAGGISFTEFSYVLLQSNDYLELFRRHGCTVQFGGADQWGNITAGVELVRRVESATVHALTTPLLTKSDGTKFGKTEGGTVWLDPDLTSAYAFFQYWLNVEDALVGSLLRTFTFRTQDEIGALEAATAERPQAREGQRALARDLTSRVHGADEAERVEAAGRALFGQGDLAAVPVATLEAALGEVPHVRLPPGPLPPVVDLLVATGLVASKSAARRAVADGGAYLNNERVADGDQPPETSALLHGRFLVLRRGRRTVGGVQVA